MPESRDAEIDQQMDLFFIIRRHHAARSRRGTRGQSAAGSGPTATKAQGMETYSGPDMGDRGTPNYCRHFYSSW